MNEEEQVTVTIDISGGTIKITLTSDRQNYNNGYKDNKILINDKKKFINY